MKTSVTDKLNKVLGVAEEIIDQTHETEKVTSTEIDVPEQTLEVEAIEPQKEITIIPSDEALAQETRMIELDSDISLVRNNLKFLIETGKDSLHELQSLATEAEEPRVYEVLGELIKSISEVSKELILLHKTRADIIKIEKESASKKDTPTNLTQNNTNVYLNTTDLIKAIREGNSNVNPMLPEQS